MSTPLEPAEAALSTELERRGPLIHNALVHARYGDVMKEIVAFREPVDRFFTDVMVMVDDPLVRDARLSLLTRLKRQILEFADPSAIAVE